MVFDGDLVFPLERSEGFPCSLCVSGLVVCGGLSSSVLVSFPPRRCNCVPMEKVAKGVIFALFRVAGVVFVICSRVATCGESRLVYGGSC